MGAKSQPSDPKAKVPGANIDFSVENATVNVQGAETFEGT